MSSLSLVPRIEARILVLRGQRVMLDADLAALYGVETRALNQAVKRNALRFPSDFHFPLTEAEKAEVITNCDHLQRLKFSKNLPFAFTEHGAIQAANVLASQQAVEMGIFVVRAFVQLREAAIAHQDLAKRLDKLEKKTEVLQQSHENLARDTQVELKHLFDAIRQLIAPPEKPKRPIGFVVPQEKNKTTSRKISSKSSNA